MGRNNLNSLLSQLCQEAGIAGKKTNHSLRATGATTLFNAQVPEKMIKEITGHHSSKALSLYERPSLAQKQAVSKVIAGGGASFPEEVQKIQANDQSKKLVATPTTSQTKIRATHSQSANPGMNPAGFLSSLFNGLTNCNVNFSTQQLNINFGTLNPEMKQLEEFDAIVENIPPSSEY